jgi:hypothetical protein
MLGTLQAVLKFDYVSLVRYSKILVLAIGYDLILLIVSGRVIFKKLLPKAHIHYQYLGVAVSLLLCGIKVLVAAIFYKYGAENLSIR